MPTDPTTPASRPALPLRAVTTTVIYPSGPPSRRGLIRDGRDDTVADCPVLAEAEWLVAQANAAAELRGLLAECGRVMGEAAEVMRRAAAHDAAGYMPATAKRLGLSADELAALAAKVAAAVGPAKAETCCEFCALAGGGCSVCEGY